MKFAFVIGYTFAIDPARRLLEAGHDVVVGFIGGANDTYDGIVPHVADWRDCLTDPDRIIVFDDTGNGALQDSLRAEGRRVVGGSAAGERLEADRAYGQEVCRELGLPVVPYRQFDDLAEAIAFLEANPGRWVVKHGQDDDIRTLDVRGRSEQGSDVLARLRWAAAHWGSSAPARGLMIQQYIHGVEVGVGAFFNGRDFVMPYAVAFEHQQLMAGEIGPNTGEMYTTLWHRSDREHRIFAEALEPLTPFLREQRHVGYVDLNAIVNETGFHPLEWTVRLGMPTSLAQIRMMAGHLDLATLFAGLADGTLERYETEDGYAIAAVVAAPPFPFAGYEQVSKGMPVFFPEDPEFLEHLHLLEIRRDPDGTYLTAGDYGYCFVVTDRGATPEIAGRRVLRRIERIEGLPWLYRNDLGRGETKKLRRLAEYGYDVALPGPGSR